MMVADRNCESSLTCGSNL